VVRAVHIPVNADGEDGFGGPDDVRETVRSFVGISAAGMNLEDSVHGPGARSLVPLEQQLEKIDAFVDARSALGSEFLLNARVDSYGVMQGDPRAALADALRRGASPRRSAAPGPTTSWTRRSPPPISAPSSPHGGDRWASSAAVPGGYPRVDVAAAPLPPVPLHPGRPDPLWPSDVGEDGGSATG
jgi:hypothetical protein